jgi:hypothetical protein
MGAVLQDNEEMQYPLGVFISCGLPKIIDGSENGLGCAHGGRAAQSMQLAPEVFEVIAVDHCPDPDYRGEEFVEELLVQFVCRGPASPRNLERFFQIARL